MLHKKYKNNQPFFCLIICWASHVLISHFDMCEMQIAQLAVFVRTGFWLTDNAQDLLTIQIEGEDSFRALKQQFGELVLTIHLRDRKVMENSFFSYVIWNLSE